MENVGTLEGDDGVIFLIGVQQMPQSNSSSYGYSSRESSRAWIVSLVTGGTFSKGGSSLLLLTDPVKSIVGISVNSGV